MLTRTAPLVAAFTAVACAAAQPPRAARRPAERFVLVSGGTRLRPQADDYAPGFPLPQAVAFRRVRTRGEWVELETVADPGGQCAAALAPPDGMRLRFFVHPSSLEPVLARPLTLQGPEGSLRVQQGVAVRTVAGPVPSAEITHDGLHLALAVAPDTAREFRAPRVERDVVGALRVASGTRATLPAAATAQVAPGATVYAVSRRPASEGARVTVATRCVRFEALVPERALLPVLELEVSTREEVAVARRAVRAGARVRWSDGTPAGRTVARVDMPDEGRTVGAMRCFHAPLRVVGDSAPPIDAEVCAAEQDVEAAR